jgi:hypothetical protein
MSRPKPRNAHAKSGMKKGKQGKRTAKLPTIQASNNLHQKVKYAKLGGYWGLVSAKLGMKSEKSGWKQFAGEFPVELEGALNP